MIFKSTAKNTKLHGSHSSDVILISENDDTVRENTSNFPHLFPDTMTPCCN